MKRRLSNKSQKLKITPARAHSGRGEIVKIGLVRQLNIRPQSSIGCRTYKYRISVAKPVSIVVKAVGAEPVDEKSYFWRERRSIYAFSSPA